MSYVTTKDFDSTMKLAGQILQEIDGHKDHSRPLDTLTARQLFAVTISLAGHLNEKLDQVLARLPKESPDQG